MRKLRLKEWLCVGLSLVFLLAFTVPSYASYQALELDGSGYASIADASQAGLGMGLSDFMVEARIKTTSSGAYETIVCKAAGAPSYMGWILWKTNTDVVWWIIDSGVNAADCKSTRTISDGQWHYVVALADRDSATGMKMYLNGSEITYAIQADPTAVVSTDSAVPVCIGIRNEADALWTGLTDEVRVWNFGKDGLPTDYFPTVTGASQIDTATYDAFGLLIRTGADEIMYFFREGTSHVGDKGKIVKDIYTPSSNTWAGRTDVYDDGNADYDVRSAAGGIIGSHIFIFFLRWNKDTSTAVDAGYIKSTDLTGSSWGSYVEIPTGDHPYGHIVSTSDPNTFLQPCYASGNVRVFKTTDSGDNWSIGSTIYSGGTSWTETCVAYIGNSEMIALLRRNDGGYVGQATSSDDGETWSAVSNTNLGRLIGVKIPYIIYDSVTEKAIVIYHDRGGTGETKISATDAGTVFPNANRWNDPMLVDSGFLINGYPSMVKVTEGEYFFVYSKQIDAGDADTWGGDYLGVSYIVWRAEGRNVFKDISEYNSGSWDCYADAVRTELITNGDMEADSTWEPRGSPTTEEQSTDQANGGSNSWKIISDEAGEGAYQDITTVVDEYYEVTGYFYVTAGDAKLGKEDTDGSDQVLTAQATAAAWTEFNVVFLATETTSRIFFQSDATDASTFYADDVSVKRTGLVGHWKLEGNYLDEGSNDNDLTVGGTGNTFPEYTLKRQKIIAPATVN